MIIRDYSESDLLPLSILYLDIRSREFSWTDSSALTIHDFENDTKGETVLVADDDGYPAGFISIWKPTRFIHCLYVDHSCRNRGIATALIREAGRRFGMPLSLKCMDANDTAKAFYKKMGWRETGREVLPYGLCLDLRLDRMKRT